MAYSENGKKATIKYQKTHKERVVIWVKNGESDKLKACAIRHGYKAVSRFIIDAINEKAKEQVIEMPQEVYTHPLTWDDIAEAVADQDESGEENE